MAEEEKKSMCPRVSFGGQKKEKPKRKIVEEVKMEARMLNKKKDNCAVAERESGE